ncbi:hypothetical protein BABINDRAFT_161334 [Babjeviella inositovora NRRL Y-12698]|uniref:Bicarbonate transporter-like transmembrane domain-containing protein n=1 Tax=Babjeviella inositovora NRRL Y-12698 TaxID=984486 RepID=A0A1E3QTX1_9ASCO|nr:uncharacterized protein BABINDRAFT_161334 [Babjeviella inositovora NRRL Y-12698]ODQ80387.1 hypothetical protein BABINDRAFT_161334 [Babjeviella inositovora NRRL Y-12698]
MLFIRYFGKGITQDIHARLKVYVLDWTDAWDYRVIPSTVYVFFTNLLPAIAFAQDMFDKTHNSYGVNEVLLSSGMAGVVFGLLSGQPLCVVGVTGPISIFNYTVYELITPRGTPFFPFMAWVCLWSMVMHFAIAFANGVNYTRYISKFSCEVFGFFINFVYIQKGIQILTKQFTDISYESGYLSIVIALLMTLFGVAAAAFGNQSHYFKPVVRKIFADYGTPLCVVFYTGFAHFGNISRTELARLPITLAFHPTVKYLNALDGGRPDGWFIHFWKISVGDVFLAIPFAILLTLLFYYDHNISSLICQASKYPLKKPASFHWDFCLLGITTGVAGILGIPAPNGLIPQAPLHTDSLCVHDPKTGKITRVVEQRFTNTVQGLMTIGMMTRPLLVVLGLIPQAVLSGLFFIMGLLGINGNAVTNRLRFICMDKEFTHSEFNVERREEFQQYAKPDKKWHYVYVTFLLILFVAEFSITNTKGAVGFPGVLIAGMLWACYFHYIFPKDQLALLDGPAADKSTLANLHVGSSDSTMVNTLDNSEDEEAEIGETKRVRKVRRVAHNGDKGSTEE